MQASSSVARANAESPPKRARLAAFVALTVSLLLGLGAAEWMVRRFQPQSVRTPMFDQVDGLRTLTPNTRARLYVPGLFDTIQTVGPQRFRGSRSYDLRPAPGAWRIATIGDSFTFGDGANDDEAYPSVLEGLLRKSNPNVEVINAGVPGDGTGEEALYFEHWVRNFHPNLVILEVVVNDPDDDAARQLFTRGADGNIVPIPAEQRTRNSRTYQLLRAVHRWRPVTWIYEHSQLAALAEDTAMHRVQRSRESRNGTSEADLPVDVQMTTAEIVWLNQRVADAGARLVVAYFPTSDVVYDLKGAPYDAWRRREQAIAQAAADGAAKAGVPFVDLTAFMQREYANSHNRLYYSGLDEHPNAQGYAALARGIAAFLSADAEFSHEANRR